MMLYQDEHRREGEKLGLKKEASYSDKVIDWYNRTWVFHDPKPSLSHVAKRTAD
jgi:hypothetical protein